MICTENGFILGADFNDVNFEEQFSFFFVSLCLGGSFVIPRGERLPYLLRSLPRASAAQMADSTISAVTGNQVE